MKIAESRMLHGRYYLLKNNVVAVRTDGEVDTDFIFSNGAWAKDRQGILFECLNDGDNELEISENKAMEMITDQALSALIGLWKNKYDKDYKEWESAPKWWAKFVETDFVMNGCNRSLVPKDFGWSDGFFESVQSQIEADLIEHGAVITGSYGMVD